MDFRAQGVGNLLQRLHHVAVVVDGIDDGAGDRQGAGRQAGHFQLPQQMLLHRLAGGVGELLLAVIVLAVPGVVGGTYGLFTPVVIDHLDLRLLIGCGRLGDLRLDHGRLDRLEATAGVGILDRLEHDIAFEQFPDMGLQLERRHLKQSYGLLQLRRHGQLLTHAQLQGRFQHVSCTMGTGPFLRS